MKKTVCCVCLAGALAASPAWAVTRTWISSVGGLWTSNANWQDGIPPAANETADLSAATGTNTINLTADVTVGEILYNPAFSGTTNTLTILSDTAAPSSRKITFSNTATPHHLQAGTGALLVFDTDLSLTANLYKDGYGHVELKRRQVAAAHRDVYLEQGKMMIGGEFLAISFRLAVGRPNADTSVPYPEVVLKNGASVVSPAGAGSDVIFGCNRTVGSSVAAHSVVTQTGGALDLSKNTTGGAFINGYSAGCTSVYNLVDGFLCTSGRTAYVAFNGVGLFNQSGGTSVFSTVTIANGAGATGTVNVTGGELWLGGTVSKGSGVSAFNIGGGVRVYPHTTGFTLNGNTSPKLTGTNGLTRFCSTSAAYTNGIGDLSGPGGLVKEGADTLNFTGTHTFTGPVIVSNGTLNVNAAMNGGNAVLVAGGALNLNAGYLSKFSSVMVTGGVFQVASNSTLVITGSDPWVRVAGTGTVKLLAGAAFPYLQGLDVSGAGAIDLSAGGKASVWRLRVGGVEQAPGMYTSANCAAITGAGTLVVGGGRWTGAGGNQLWSTGANWMAGSAPSGLYAAADLSGALSNEAPVATLVMDIAALTNSYQVLASGVSGAVLTNTCPAGATNTLFMPAEGVIQIGAGETLVMDHNLCLMGNVYKRGEGTLVLRRKTFLQTPGSTSYLCVEAGKVIACGPVTNAMVMVGKPDRSVAGATPEFILEDTPEAAINGTSFISGMSCLATSMNPGNGVFTQNGGTITPSIGWATRTQIGYAVAGATLGGTGTYNLVKGTLSMMNNLVLAINNGRGVLNQSGGLADLDILYLAAGEVSLTGGLLTLNNFGGTATSCTFYMGGGRLVPKSGTTVALLATTVFTGINGPMTFAPAAGRAITLSGALSGTGGFVKDDAGTLTLSGSGSFAGPIVLSNGTLTVSGALIGTNDVLLLGGTLGVSAVGGAKLGDLAITNGTVDLAAGVVATAERLFIAGNEWAKGVYSATNCSALAGTGRLIVGAEPGQWTGQGGDDNWSTAGNWVAGIVPNNAYTVANLSVAVSNAAPVRTLVLDLAAVTNKQVLFDSGVAGAILTNTCPAGLTNTLFLAAEGVVYVGEGQTVVFDHDLCVLGSVYKRGLGTLVLKRRSYLLPSLVTSVSAYYIVVEGGKVLNAGPMNNVLISVGKFSRTDAGPTPEFILEDTPDAAIVGTTFVTAGNINSLNPGLGIFTQNGGTVNPGVGWDTRIALVFTTAFVGTSGTGIYNLVNGTLTVTNSLRFGKNGSVNNGHYGIFNQAGGTADLQRVAGAWGEWNLTGGLFRLGTADADVGTNVTFKLGGGRLEPKTATWLVLRSPTVFTGINGDATLAPASGQTIQLSSAATSSGSGGFVKEGAGLLYLSNTNAFAGTADIHAGTCTVTAAGCLTQCSNLLVAAGAHLTFQRSGAALNTNLWLKVAADGKVHLDFTNEVEVGHLVLGGSEQPGRGRRYGSASHATPLEAVKGDFFTGTGVLKVVGPRGPEGTLLSLR